uniref:Uncharacterized protein n=1 Tax=Tanacetum cinerariifolium TaxID=118510 RepID=A0A699IS10_TANCI|nr:hypothetical protein [Tanacetum cinerariifolium]
MEGSYGVYSQMFGRYERVLRSAKHQLTNDCIQLVMGFGFDIGNNLFSNHVVKLTTESLTLPSRGVNADDTADKSLFETYVQHVNKPKSPTNKKTKNKKNLASSKPKPSNIVRESSPIKQVVDTHHDEEPVDTVDATKSIDTSESVEELRN